MKIEYKNTFSDFFWFNNVHQFLSLILQTIFILFSALLFFYELGGKNTIGHAFYVAAKVYVAMWLVQMVINFLYLFSRKNHSLLTTHKIEIQQDALYEETPFNRSFFYWAGGILKIVHRPGFLAIYISPFQAHIIPARAFASKSEKEEFFSKVRELIKKPWQA